VSTPVTFWRSVEELRAHADRAVSRDCLAGLRAQGQQPESPSRRDFLSVAGFSVAAAAISACSRGAEQKAIPFLNQPEGMTPGVDTWYATTCGGCRAGCGLLVKTRDGRPIKVEGNARSALFGGGTCAVGQATVLSLYDGERLEGPLWHGRPASWTDIDAKVEAFLSADGARPKRLVLLSRTLLGPATRALIAEWSQGRGLRHVVYEPISLAALRRATLAAFGVDAIPHFRFGRARTIVAIEADFLGTWLSPVEFTRDYASGRRPEESAAISRHIHFESTLSLTGSNADLRVAIAPSEQGAVALSLLRRIARKLGAGDPVETLETTSAARALDIAADDLWRCRGESLVVCGARDFDTQMVVHAINALLGNIGRTVDVDRPSLQHRGDDDAMAGLVEEMRRGEVDALLLYGVNPAYDYPRADEFVQAMKHVPLTISLSDRLDETAALADAVCPDHHFLEAWGDAEPVASFFSLAQPTIAPLFDTRAAQDSLLEWLGRPPDFHAYLRDHWRRTLYPRQQQFATFDEFWDRALHDGAFAPADGATARATRTLTGDWRRSAARLAARAGSVRPEGRFEAHVYETVAIRDGAHANNPWLQELPDPVTKVTWGNYAVVAPSVATRLGITAGDVVSLDGGDIRLDLPAWVQPGQSPHAVSIAVGYGRSRAGRVGSGLGTNAFPLLAADGRSPSQASLTITRTGRREPLAATQTHHSMEGRDIVRQISPAALVDDAGDRREADDAASLWRARPAAEHAWGMAVDLNACTGCSACVTACQAENNVPVVGKDEVRRGREMHWIRIDRYYTGSEDDPATLVQPMMCQHCGHAPCEPVCPVLATVHSSDGLNQQVYNRCVGTRYCENNCPYKVRRFNWFEYASNDRFDFNMNSPLGRMVLNPDVTVRSRGVMEKCSLCVQRIQAGKLAAKQEGRTPQDGDIQTACQQVCPAEAIVFGDLNDPASRLAQLAKSARGYRVLEELGTRPNVHYLAKIRNAPDGGRS